MGDAVRAIAAVASAICERFEIVLEDCGTSIVLEAAPAVRGIEESVGARHPPLHVRVTPVFTGHLLPMGMCLEW
jgi:hypothetical protein